MGGKWWGAARQWAWVFVGVGVVGVGLWVVTMALGARTDDGFDRWVGWANILALPVGALGTALVLLERASRRRSAPTGDGTPAPTGCAGQQTQHVHATDGGTAQGVMNGDIVNYGYPPPAGPHADEQRDGSR
ncbi:hypothetical protein [Micromonospora sp. NPDC048830]|uniref:hypothetical protein n=1 Tax=Micromonospora sp. NPDC048830 TaxID=3364257 RepID=UPI0037247626